MRNILTLARLASPKKTTHRANVSHFFSDDFYFASDCFCARRTLNAKTCTNQLILRKVYFPEHHLSPMRLYLLVLILPHGVVT